MRAFLALSLVLMLGSCSGGRRPAPPPPAPAPEATTAATPAPAPTEPAPAVSADQLQGGWGRAPGRGIEGLVLRPDGRLGLVGILRAEGSAWRLEGRDLVVSMTAERFPSIQQGRFHVEALTPTRLVLSGKGDLDGPWQRREFASVTGTVDSLPRVALTPEATVQLELRDVTVSDREGPLVARCVLRAGGRQLPIAFVLDYDPGEIDPARIYAISARISDRGQLQFVTEGRIPVITGGAPGTAEIVAVPVR